MTIFNINSIMKEKKVTTKELAERTGISMRTIETYRGARRKEPSYSNGLKIASALEINPYDLIVEVDDES